MLLLCSVAVMGALIAQLTGEPVVAQGFNGKELHGALAWGMAILMMLACTCIATFIIFMGRAMLSLRAWARKVELGIACLLLIFEIVVALWAFRHGQIHIPFPWQQVLIIWYLNRRSIRVLFG